MAPTSSTGDDNVGNHRAWLRAGRRCLAFLVFAGALAAYFGSWAYSDLRVCSDAVARVGTEALVERCEPLSVADIVPLIALAVVFLIPDLSELSIPGLGGVKFRLQEQERRQDQLEARLVEVAQTTSVTQSTNVSAPNYILINPAAVVEALPDKEQAFRSEVKEGRPSSDLPPLREPASPDADTAILAMALLALWSQRLEPWAELGRRMRGRLWRGLTRHYVAGTLNESSEERYGETLRRVMPEGLTDRGLAIVERWNTVFAEELAFVRGTRNAVAHPGSHPSPEPAAIRDAIVVGERLAELLEEELRTGGPGPET